MIRRVKELEKRLRDEEIRKHGSYEKRTEHLRSDGYGVFVNRLIEQDSTYLLQHAHNPVDWHPWNEQTLDKAKSEGKLLLISIGYSACHWCHVMEHESFEDAEVAKIMNDNFICIKVDREERPDIDQIYMTAVQLMNQRGGWPLNCVALPNGKPFWGGTYFRKEDWKKQILGLANTYKTEPNRAVSYTHLRAHET